MWIEKQKIENNEIYLFTIHQVLLFWKRSSNVREWEKSFKVSITLWGRKKAAEKNFLSVLSFFEG